MLKCCPMTRDADHLSKFANSGVDITEFLDGAMDAVVTADSNGDITGWSGQAKAIFGWEAAQVIDQSLTILIPERYREAHQAGLKRYLATGRGRVLQRRYELEALHREGHEFPVELSITPLHANGSVVFASFIRDLSKVRHAERAQQQLAESLESTNKELQALITLDPLTQILNRRGLADAVTQEVARAKRHRQPISAILIDCDDFSHINDVVGYGAGDVVLTELAGRLQSCLRAGDHLGRVGGDEFLILLPDAREAECEMIAERARLAAAHPPIVVVEGELTITISSAVLLLPPELASLDDLLPRAHSVLRHGKAVGKNRVSNEDVDREAVQESIEVILKKGNLRAFCQPIVRTPTPGEVTGYEMLIRGPIGAFEKPVDLFRACREQDISIRADLECFRTCIEGAMPLRGTGCFHLNLLPATLLSTPTARLVSMFPEDRRPGEFCIEISEQQLIGQPTYLAEPVRRLKAAGIMVAIDDMGFGRSPIEALVVLDPDIVKIDRSLVAQCDTDLTTQHSCARLVKILHSLEIPAIAEGVETAEELAVLAKLGVEFAQGFHMGRPRSAKDHPTFC